VTDNVLPTEAEVGETLIGLRLVSCTTVMHILPLGTASCFSLARVSTFNVSTCPNEYAPTFSSPTMSGFALPFPSEGSYSSPLGLS